MLKNYFKVNNALLLVAIMAWVYFSYLIAQFSVLCLAWLLQYFKVSFDSVNSIVLNTVFSVVIYIVAIAVVIGVPWVAKKRKTTLKSIGLNKLPSWTHIFIAPAGFIVYIILSAIFISMTTKFFPGFDINQVQETGFDHLNKQFEYTLAFLVLVVVGPFAEEILFRGYLFSKLKKVAPVWIAVIATSVLFGFVHRAWNLAIDTFALSIVLCYLRELSGSLWPSILLHMIKNSIAFYILFINPSILATLIR